MKKAIFILLYFNLLLYSQSNDTAQQHAAFMKAAIDGNMSFIKSYLESQNGILYIDYKGGKYGETALMYAASEGHLEIAKLLIDKGAYINAKNNNSFTALMYASFKGRLEIVELLIDNGANVNIKNLYGDAALNYASKKGYLEIVKLLIDKGANVNAKDNYGFTSLMKAAEEGYLEIVKLLIDKGANVNAKNKYGSTALMYTDNLEISKLLKQYGAEY